MGPGRQRGLNDDTRLGTPQIKGLPSDKVVDLPGIVYFCLPLSPSTTVLNTSNFLNQDGTRKLLDIKSKKTLLINLTKIG